MKSHISKVRIAALAVGLAIVMSSCGIQNQAGDSSSSSGKTKNYAISQTGTCWDSVENWRQDWRTTIETFRAERGHFPDDLRFADAESYSGLVSEQDQKYADDLFLQIQRFLPGERGGFWEEMGNGEPCPAGTQSSDVGSGTVNVRSCLPQALIDAGIAGFAEQLNKTDYPADWTQAMIDNYKAEMQRGIDALKGTCVSN